VAGLTDSLPVSLKRRIRLTRRVLWWEAALPLAWPLVTLILLFLALAQLDLLPWLPGWLHALVLAVFALGLLAALWPLHKLHRPDDAACLRRIEEDNGLTHRPFQALEDSLVIGSESLWQAQRDRLIGTLSRPLRTGFPRPLLARHDPWGLRALPILLLAIGLAGNGLHDIPERLDRALSPQWSWGGPPPSLQVWLTPPDYTHRPPILLEPGLLEPGRTEPVEIPIGSRLLAQLQGASATAKLVLENESRAFERLDDDSQKITAPLIAGDRIELRLGWRRLAAWPIHLLPDQPPEIALSEPVTANEQGRLKIALQAKDDYGIAQIRLILRRSAHPQESTEVAIASPHGAEVSQTSWIDLTGHPWAGLEVILQPQAEDGAGQTGVGTPQSLILPEREFHNSFAQAIAKLRRQLSERPDNRQGPITVLDAMLTTLEITRNNDPQLIIPLSAARSRLKWNQEPDAVPSTQALLWQVALRLEDGERPKAEQSLTDAQDALEQALENGASAEELDRLSEELDQALRNYLELSLADLNLLSSHPGKSIALPQEMADLLQQMHDAAQLGSRDGAKAAAQRLREMTEQLKAALDRVRKGESPAQAQARQAAQALQQVIKDQQDLLNQTFQLSRHPDALDPADSDHLAAQQLALRNRLDPLAAHGSKGLKDAADAMTDAALSLGQGELEDALELQNKALELMQQGLSQLSPGLSLGGQSGRDPLGRPTRTDSQDIGIPNQSDRNKAHDILDDLRQRAAQPKRDPAERDYLQRLLKEFF